MKQAKQENPLVSIIVITYNSAKYVLETLESAKVQTYKNIELIISDDCSADNTVELCQAWLKINKDRFVRAILLTAEKNTGITSNCNRGLYAARGGWIKLIAGDDTLEPNCIFTYVDHINKNPNIKVFHSRHTAYLDTFSETNKQIVSLPQKVVISRLVSNINDQKKIILLNNYISAPSVLICRDVLIEIGGFDEDIQMVEDWPLWMKLSNGNYYVKFIDFFSCKYRIHSSAISYENTRVDLLSKFYVDNDKVVRKYIVPKMKYLTRVFYELSYAGKKFMFENGLLKKNILNTCIFYLTQSAFSLNVKLNLKYSLFRIRYFRK